MNHHQPGVNETKPPWRGGKQPRGPHPCPGTLLSLLLCYSGLLSVGVPGREVQLQPLETTGAPREGEEPGTAVHVSATTPPLPRSPRPPGAAGSHSGCVGVFVGPFRGTTPCRSRPPASHARGLTPAKHRRCLCKHEALKHAWALTDPDRAMSHTVLYWACEPRRPCWPLPAQPLLSVTSAEVPLARSPLQAWLSLREARAPEA